MKAIIYSVAIFFAGSLFFSCNKKSIPVITERKTGPKQEWVKARDIVPDLAAGKRIFLNRCGKCHGLPETKSYPAEKWVKIMSYMGPRAGLDTEQNLHVLTFLGANAADKPAELK